MWAIIAEEVGGRVCRGSGLDAPAGLPPNTSHSTNRVLKVQGFLQKGGGYARRRTMQPEDRREAIATLEKRVEHLRPQNDDLSDVVILALEDVIADLDSDRPSRVDPSATD
jgi:hypothetical protein